MIAPMAAPPHSVMLVQVGARRNYIYARQLEAAGLLHSLVSDACWAEKPGPVASLTARLLPRLAPPMARRTVTGIAPERVRPVFSANIAEVAKLFVHEQTAYAFIDDVVGAILRLRGGGVPKVVVNYLGNGGLYLRHAKRRGARIITDFIITPRCLDIEAEEQQKFPDWEPQRTSATVRAAYRKRMSAIMHLSDIYLCPSQTVARDLALLDGFDPARVRIVPYGLSGVLLREAQPIQGRVLFAGAAGLRKGLPYLGQAATILKSRVPHIEICVAGDASAHIRSRPEVRDITFLGHLGREAMAGEFARADVFCLPSLAEGSATSIFEAMANGLPVVTTPSSGSVVRDGVDGIMVPERDGAAIAAAIEHIVTNRATRGTMSAAARAMASKYTDATCGAFFLNVVSEQLCMDTRASAGS